MEDNSNRLVNDAAVLRLLLANGVATERTRLVSKEPVVDALMAEDMTTCEALGADEIVETDAATEVLQF